MSAPQGSYTYEVKGEIGSATQGANYDLTRDTDVVVAGDTDLGVLTVPTGVLRGTVVVSDASVAVADADVAIQSFDIALPGWSVSLDASAVVLADGSFEMPLVQGSGELLVQPSAPPVAMADAFDDLSVFDFDVAFGGVSGRADSRVGQRTGVIDALMLPGSGSYDFYDFTIPGEEPVGSVRIPALDDDLSLNVMRRPLSTGVGASLLGPGTVSSDVDGDGATESDPIEVTVASPVAGLVTITKQGVSGPDPSGHALLGHELDITAPGATADAPLVLEFLIDCSIVPGDCASTLVDVFRNGEAVPECGPAPGVADPDPCVSSREVVDGDLRITVLTSAASFWTFGVPFVTDGDSDGIIDTEDACPDDPEDLTARSRWAKVFINKCDHERRASAGNRRAGPLLRLVGTSCGAEQHASRAQGTERRGQ